MKQLSKDQAERIAELTSEIYQQGPSWVLKEMDLESGLYKLTRGLGEKSAEQKLQSWRREKTEQLLRASPKASAYTLRKWHSSHAWNGEGVWHWVKKNWYTTLEEAERARKALEEQLEERCEIYETAVENIPGHFVVA